MEVVRRLTPAGLRWLGRALVVRGLHREGLLLDARVTTQVEPRRGLVEVAVAAVPVEVTVAAAVVVLVLLWVAM